jgi:hypothetical protein
MRGFAASNGDVAFDSYLILHKGWENHTLTVVLKIHLRQMLDQSQPQAYRIAIPDRNTPPRWFLIKPWEGAKWAKFVKDFKQECAKWNNQFWLIPPANFSKLDITVGQQTIRPNVYCHLDVEVVGAPGAAHRTIEVVNLDTKDATTRLGIKEKDLDGGTFISDATRYDSLDVKGRSIPTQDDQGKWHKAKHSTIVHEIGHALGLPHIGVTHQDRFCQFAVLLDQLSPGAAQAALFKGGSNAQVCYGHLGPPIRSQNVMGGGTRFEDSNAAPWVKRLAFHTATKPQDWKVSTKKVGPKLVESSGPGRQYYRPGFDSTYISGGG